MRLMQIKQGKIQITVGLTIRGGIARLFSLPAGIVTSTTNPRSLREGYSQMQRRGISFLVSLPHSNETAETLFWIHKAVVENPFFGFVQTGVAEYATAPGGGLSVIRKLGPRLLGIGLLSFLRLLAG